MSNRLGNGSKKLGGKNDVQPIVGREQNWNGYSFKLDPENQDSSSQKEGNKNPFDTPTTTSKRRSGWISKLFSRKIDK